MKTVIFDMDGVIVDSEYTYFESKTKILQNEGFDVDISYQYQFMGMTYNAMWEIIIEEIGLIENIDHYIEEMNRIRHEIIAKDGVRAIKDVVKLIERLKRVGYSLGLASSSPKIEIINNLTELNIIHHFDVLVSGEEVAHSKPQPDVFLRAAELMKVNPEETIIIEDTRNGSIAAKASGAYCIGFANPDYPSQDLSASDKIITSFNDIVIDEKTGYMVL